ncbi:glycosyltransferase [Microbacterium sp. BK668]|uniref:glycosyltransferase n=1 Tax=Microbacterium sp. BK668 TaxID=2512118 RepID=UPI00105EE068|nr:glycosyltransferase [Microbacterium sp. BK668]TDN90552.1 UDP-N-acetylglucosamine:LPS N-acetylglucosamine transferase [Microbacterium sp. BK668]
MSAQLDTHTAAKSLFVCSTGGHLTELRRIEERDGINPDSLWVTFDTPQSRQALEGRRVHYLPYVGPRDLKGTLRSVPSLRRVLRGESFDAAVSTGAAIAAAALPLATLHGIPSIYIESVCRLRGPSTTGKLLMAVPGVELRTQHAEWAGGRWSACPSILDSFRSEERLAPEGPLRVFITLGTIRGYRFDSVIDAFLSTGLANETTVWQLGDTTRTDALPGNVYDYLSPDEFAFEAARADVVITHAGVGTLVELLSMGIYPVQAIRRALRNEHVDDHQLEIAELVETNGIGIPVEGPGLTEEVIRYAAGRRIVDGRLAKVETV